MQRSVLPRFCVHRPTIRGHTRLEKRLKNLGLYNFSRLREADDEIEATVGPARNVHRETWVKLDFGLITALIEFWRLETHTFHFPAREMIVTYEDVSHLWGLPTWGAPVFGPTDVGGDAIIANLLTADGDISGSRRSSENRKAIRLSWLRGLCKQFPHDEDEAGWDRYVRAYALELFDCDVSNPYDINWGAAVLACLFRSLDTASSWRPGSGVQNVGGPLLLLQMWAWTRLPVCRPGNTFNHDLFGLPDRASAVPYGRYIYPGRVARQFGKRQIVPPPATKPWSVQKELNEINNSTDRDTDWSDAWSWVKESWDNMEGNFLYQAGPFELRRHDDEYWTWYHKYGASNRIVYVEVNTANLDVREAAPPPARLPRLQQEPSWRKTNRTIARTLQVAYTGARLAIVRGYRQIGKSLLLTCRWELQDANQPTLLQDVLSRHNLPPVDDISVTPPEDVGQHIPGSFAPNQEVMNWLESEGDLDNPNWSTFQELLGSFDVAGETHIPDPSSTQEVPQPSSQFDTQQTPPQSFHHEFDISVKDYGLESLVYAPHSETVFGPGAHDDDEAGTSGAHDEPTVVDRTPPINRRGSPRARNSPDRFTPADY
ncbi:Serine/threonine-protein phosphatase 7 long form-like protein [Rhynchospora pubera]|uniref:Serine/threonine-protein phosphatase 7 long form-like protein n=1 Tax=Rhynchospora pubera TaxID=906938 RepID=A0AAV8GXG5_9POAL|nr:Serine/threonine-protein phosphatase 7 long form-like protein [Rhynchospora pubera]